MLAAHKCFSVTCRSCCCQTCKVDHLKKAFEHTKNCITYKCLCKSSTCTCSHNASHSVTSHESYRCSQDSQDVLNVMCAGNLTCTSLSSASHVQCTCRAELQLSLCESMSVAHCMACIGRHPAKPEHVIQVVRCDESVNNAAANHNYYHHCCTCSCQHCGMSGYKHKATLSGVTSGVCVGCTEFTQVNRREQPDCRLTLRHSDARSVEQQQEKTVSLQSGSVVVDVSEWQRRHIEQLDRQKLEV